MHAQRGFTLPELLVATGILVLLLAAAIYSLSMRPGALFAGAAGFDAALSAAKAIAAASGNGATLAFAPRTNPQGRRIAGFELRVYAGRPKAPGALAATTVGVVVSDADLSEAALGAPPLALFINSAGYATGKPAYAITAHGGTLAYTILTQEPACPSDALHLTFRDAHGNTATRALPCAVTAVGLPAPIATMTPGHPLLSPPQIVFVYPGEVHAHFVATEWGYTRWYAATDGFHCGGAATFDAQPQPYTPPHSDADLAALPQVPTGLPYSFANSTESMQDAPAWFWIAPAAPGTCSASITDAFGQQAEESVQVMGSLAIVPERLTFDASSSPAQSARLSKTFDAVPIAASVLGSNCNGIAEVTIGAGSAPPQPSLQPATTPITILPRGAGACTVAFGDQYTARGEPPANLTISVGQPCSLVGGSCVLHLPANVEGGSCDPSGQMGGTNLFYSAAFAAGSEDRGTLVDDGDGTWTFTRTAAGAVTIDEIETSSTLVPRTGPNSNQGCSAIVHHRIVRTWSF